VTLLLTATAVGQAASSAKHKTAKRTEPVQQELNVLRALVTAQQQQMELQREQMDEIRGQLQQLVDANQQANSSAQNVQTSVAAAQATARKAEQDATEAQRLADQAGENAVEAKTALALVSKSSEADAKRVSALEGVVGRFRFSGDVRVRGESFFQDCPACLDRNRARLRARFGLEGKLNEDFTGGIYLATGSLGDSNSTNETVTSFFNRKTIALDRAFILYQPLDHKWVQLTAGKFAYTWQRTSATFDPDLNPEGFSEKFSFDLKTPILKNLSVQAMQLLYSENNDAKFLNANDSFAVGGQVSAKLEFGPLTSTPSFTILNWRNPDSILNASAFAVQSTTTGTAAGTTTSVTGLPVPGEGPGCAKGSGLPAVPPCVFGPQGFTNATLTDENGKIHFLSGFLYADFILNNQLKTGWKRFPVNFLLEYQDNLNAADHPLDATGAPTNLGSQSHAYLVDVSVGQSKAKNDLQFGYAWVRAEQDSAISSFIESENRAPTNLLQNRLYFLWRVRSNTVASYNLWIGRTLNSNLQHAIVAPGTVAGTAEPWLFRHQFDLVYSF
jgi:hypothetical protein